jgi:hypothetical protein
MIQGFTGLVQDCAERQVDPFQRGQPAVPFGIRQSSKQLVFFGIG